MIVEQVFEGDVTSTRLARVSRDVLCSVNDVKKTIQFAWWSGESAASLPMTFQHADLPVVKSQLMNDVQVMNQRSFTNAFLQGSSPRTVPMTGCDYLESDDVWLWHTCYIIRGATGRPLGSAGEA